MRIVCPTASSQYISGVQPSHATRCISAKGKQAEGKRIRVNNRDAKIAHATEAKKKNAIKQKAQSRRATVFEINYVYVGNLESSVTEERLAYFFRDCGSILRICFRCSRGGAIAAGVAIPEAARSPRDRLYATIEFHKPASVRMALGYHGKILDGSKLVVSASPADLPEVAEALEAVAENFEKGNAWPKPPGRDGKARNLIQQDTERFVDFHRPENDRNRLFGFSFAKGLV